MSRGRGEREYDLSDDWPAIRPGQDAYCGYESELIASTPDLRVYITPDTDPSNPRENACLGSIWQGTNSVRWNDNLAFEDEDVASDLDRLWRRHEFKSDLDRLARFLRIYRGATCVLPLDSRRTGTGLIFDTPYRREETGVAVQDIPDALASEMEEYAQFLDGDVWGYVIENRDEEQVDACWGFIGRAYARQEALSAFIHHATKNAA